MATRYDAEFPTLSSAATASRQVSISSISQLHESRRSTPAVPPGLEDHVQSRRGTPTVPPGFTKPPTGLPDLEGTGSRPSTPAIPPGFSKAPSALPDLEGAGSRPGSRTGLRRAVSGQVALPLRPGTPMGKGAGSRTASRAGSPVKRDEEEGEEEVLAKRLRNVAVPKALQKGGESKEVGAGAAKESEKSVPPAKENEKPAPLAEPVKAKASATAGDDKSVLSKDGAAQGKAALVPRSQEPDLKVEKNKAPVSGEAQKAASSSVQPTSKGQAMDHSKDLKEQPSAPSKADATKADSTKRKHPGKLDITAAVENQSSSATAGVASTATPVEASTPGKQRAVSQTTSVFSVPASPSASVSSPVVKNAPRTLRVVQTPKAETFPATTAAALPPAAAAAISKLPSRQPSVASMNPPGTPSSEQISISDNLSMTSTSQSRANTPPPPGVGRVGSAPVRAKTKNQQKKERREQAKAAEEEKVKEQEVEKTAPEETTQEAIISRKKKARKEKDPKPAKAKAVAQKDGPATRDTTPTVSRPVSPGPKEKKAEPVAPKPATPVKTVQHPVQPPQEPSPPPTPTLSPAQIIADLRAADPSIQRALDSLFRSSGAPSLKPTQPITPQDLANPAAWKADFNIKLTKDEVEALLKGTAPAVQYGGEEGRIWDRGLVTPSGAHLRALTQDLERRFLDLEGCLRSVPEEWRFRPTKPQNETKFPAFDLEGLRREFESQGGRGVSVMEAMVGEGGAGKKGAFLVDEAGRYVNEFVMPPVSPPPAQGQAKPQTSGGAQKEGLVQGSLGEVERMLQEARRVAEEREAALRKVVKRNRKVVGL